MAGKNTEQRGHEQVLTMQRGSLRKATLFAIGDDEGCLVDKSDLCPVVYQRNLVAGVKGDVIHQ